MSDPTEEITLTKEHRRKVLLRGINLWQQKKIGKKNFSPPLHYLNSFNEKDPVMVARDRKSLTVFLSSDSGH